MEVVKQGAGLLGQKVTDYQMLVKMRLSLTVVFSSVMAYLIASQGAINWWSVSILALGGFLTTGAANALNQVLEKDFDKLMKRTANRPLAAGRMTVSEAVLASGFMSLIGISLLAFFNPLAALLGTLALVSYAYIYTPLKRVSPISLTVGAFPGALPMLIGCVAAEGELTALGFALFGIQFLWQFPHFWAIGWLGHEDYKNAGYKILPSMSGELDRNTGLQAAIYALLLVPITWIPFYFGNIGLLATVVSTGLAIIYAGFGLNLFYKANRKAALQLMFSSFFYLPIVLLLFFFDKI